MNKDIRISVSFPSHYKTVLLYKRLGAEGIKSLVYLWLYAGAHRTDGRLTNMSRHTIAIAAQWEKEPDEFIDALLSKEIHFLDKAGEIYVLHDWFDHNPYAAHAKNRSEIARQNAMKRWGRGSLKETTDAKMQIKCKGNATLMQLHNDCIRVACKLHNDGITGAFIPQCPFFLTCDAPSPSPSPSPSPKYITDFILEFEKLWKDYPLKDGQKEALRHFKATVKKYADLEAIKKALKNYKNHLLNVSWKNPKSGSTWFNNWQDWVEWKEPVKPDSRITEIISGLKKEVEGKGNKTAEKVISKLESGVWSFEAYEQYHKLKGEADYLYRQWKASGAEDEKIKFEDARNKVREMLDDDVA